MTYIASTRPKPLTAAERQAARERQQKLRAEAATAHRNLITGSRHYPRTEVADILASLSVTSRFQSYAE